MPQQFIHDPQAQLDYTINWADWLGSDTISTSTWTVESGLTEGTNTSTSTTATIWLSGGTAGQTYSVTNRIVTAGGRTDERTITLKVRNR